MSVVLSVNNSIVSELSYLWLVTKNVCRSASLLLTGSRPCPLVSQ